MHESSLPQPGLCGSPLRRLFRNTLPAISLLREAAGIIIFICMSYECRYLRGTFCDKRKKECDPGEPGCVLRGRVSFPLKEPAPRAKKAATPRTKPHNI